MMLRKFFFAALLFVSIISFSQQKDTSFTREWLHIDTLILKNGLTKTALDKVNQLYERASKQNLPAQKIKCLIYRYSLENIVTAKGPIEITGDLRKEIKNSNDPVLQSLYRLLFIKQLQKYFQNNRWVIYNRKSVVNNQNQDIDTWTIDDFRKNITQQFKEITQNIPALEKITVDQYDAILIKGHYSYAPLDLADLCLVEAIDFYKSEEYFVSRTSDFFSLQDPAVLNELNEFIETKFTSPNDDAHHFITLQLYQQLLRKHKNRNSLGWLLQFNLERIEWAYEQARFPNKDYHYENALKKTTALYPSTPAIASYWYALAATEKRKGDSYHPFLDTTHRYALAHAKKIITDVQSSFDTSLPAVQKMRTLLSEIKSPRWSIKTEHVNPINKKFRARIAYKNIDTLYIRILKARNDGQEAEPWKNEFWEKIVSITPFNTITQILPKTTDHQYHGVEIALPELPSGEYELLCSNDPTFKNDNTSKLSHQRFTISNISYIKNKNDIFVLHRETGKPLANVTVSIFENTYNSALYKYQLKLLAKKATDKNGYLNFIEKKNYATYKYTFETKSDRLSFSRTEYDNYFEPVTNELTESGEIADYENKTKRILFFTDRSIYRPGQTLFFKGIGTMKDYATQQHKVIGTKDSIWVYLQNVNRKTIDSARYQLNSYGSFSGRFTLPMQGLTGNYSIYTKREYGNSSAFFSVEEYKRPTFSVILEKPKEAYQLNDSITVSGTAKAFAGNSIDGAKVTYTITRDVRFRYYNYRQRPTNAYNRREISQGILTTDAAGNFQIKFKATTDDITIEKGSTQLFDFSVSATVTDANGETRSAQTAITTGNTSLSLSITVPEWADANLWKDIPVSTTNLSNEKEPAIVQIKITSLQHPDRLIKKRLWERPDLFLYNAKDFISLFPNDEYENESDPSTWSRGSLLQQTDIDTKNTDKFILTNPLPPGHYEIEATTKDKNGTVVKTVNYVKVFNSASRQLPSPEYDFTFTKKETVEPGDTAVFVHGVSANEIFVISKTERFNRKAVLEYQTRKKGLTDISFSPTETDRGGMIITEAYVIHNRMYTQTYRINVPWTNKQLEVEYSSYRNKTEPGNKENWTIKIKGLKGDETDAEVLTGMYDASLDQFKQHQWQKPALWLNNRWNNYFYAGDNFSIQQSLDKYTHTPFIEYQEVELDRIAIHSEDLMVQNLRYWSQHPASFLSTLAKKNLVESLKYTSKNSYSFYRNELMDQNKAMSPPTYETAAAKKVTTGLNADTASGLFSYDASVGNNDIKIRGAGVSTIVPGSLLLVDGVIVPSISNINPADIISSEYLEPVEAIKRFGQKAEKGALIITTKNAQTPVVIRKNFNETAFFYPHLYADSTGNYSFSFTMPEAVTQWKWMTIAHNKELAFGSAQADVITQKTLMAQANAPRFMREGDKIEFSAKVSNLSDQELSGQIMLELIDASAGSSVDGWFQNVFPSQYFTVPAKQSSVVKFPIQIPFSFNRALTWRLVAKAGNYSDGEENTVPVLTNRQLVTESLPILVTKDTTQTFRFEKLINANSPSLTHEALTISYTANPIWEAIRSLPYLMEYPYECVEQTFNRFYANALAHYIINRDPKIKKVFERWQKDTVALKSKLQLNESLKQVMLEETPWVFEAETQEQKNKNLALLFDVFRMNQQSDQLIKKLEDMQLPDGSFTWFKGGYADRYMTNYIMTGIGKLKRLGAITPDIAIRLKPIIDKAIKFLDATITRDYRSLKAARIDSIKPILSGFELQYLYMRSFFRDIQQTGTYDAYSYYYDLGKKNIQRQSIYNKSLLGLIYFRNNEKRFVNVNIVSPILENAVEDPSNVTLYWKDRAAYSWYTSQIEHQSTVIQFLQEVMQDQNFVGGQKNIDRARNWLLLNKQTNHWNTTVATADAAYSLIMTGTDLLHTDKNISIQLGTTVYNNQTNTKEAGTGYFQQRVEGRLIKPEMGNIQVTVQTKGDTSKESISWGAVHWQYFEDMDKITPSATPLSITKELFVEKNSNTGKVLEALKENDVVKPGDKVIVRMIIKSDRPMEYLHLKDTRSATMEPVNVLSGFKWQDRLGYYESTKDASTNFFIGQLNKGTYVFDYPVYITHTGVFSTGNASIQCMYAPEFTANSGGMILRVEE
jgi:5-hydroxyisourate hydrolase-like protein (transthyretin family)